MRKRLLIAAVVLGLGAMLTVGASLAFFTDKEEAYNVVTMGSIDIEMNEKVPTPGAGEVWKVTQKTEDGNAAGLEYTNILPGATLEKKTEISNIGTNSAYIREKISVTVTGMDGTELSADGLEFWRVDDSSEEVKETRMFVWGSLEGANGSVREETITTDEITGDCMTIYGDDILGSGENTYLFSHVRVPASWGNAYAGATIRIQLTAEAIQSDFIEVPEHVGHPSERAWAAFQNF